VSLKVGSSGHKCSASARKCSIYHSAAQIPGKLTNSAPRQDCEARLPDLDLGGATCTNLGFRRCYVGLTVRGGALGTTQTMSVNPGGAIRQYPRGYTATSGIRPKGS